MDRWVDGWIGGWMDGWVRKIKQNELFIVNEGRMNEREEKNGKRIR